MTIRPQAEGDIREFVQLLGAGSVTSGHSTYVAALEQGFAGYRDPLTERRNYQLAKTVVGKLHRVHFAHSLGRVAATETWSTDGLASVTVPIYKGSLDAPEIVGTSVRVPESMALSSDEFCIEAISQAVFSVVNGIENPEATFAIGALHADRNRSAEEMRQSLILSSRDLNRAEASEIMRMRRDLR